MQGFLDAVLPQAEYLLRIIVAALCGLLIGLERENRLKDAGIRTHLMVALASALMMIVSKYGFFDLLNPAVYGDLIKLDPSRVAAGIVTGIGFIGAGTIFVRKQVVSGLTTAAGLWATVGVGMAIGGGMYAIGIAATVIILLWQFVLHRQLRLFSQGYVKQIVIKVQKESEPYVSSEIDRIFKEQHFSVVSFKGSKSGHGTSELEVVIKQPKDKSIIEIAAILQDITGIISVEI